MKEEIAAALEETGKVKSALVLGDPGEELLIWVAEAEAVDKVTNILSRLGKKLGQGIRCHVTCSLTDLEPPILYRAIHVSRPLVGDVPNPTLKQLGLGLKAIVAYSFAGLTQAEKMRVQRILHGSKTKKRSQGKVYVSECEGLFTKCGSEQIGRGAVLAPLDSVPRICYLLKQHRVNYEKKWVWTR